MKQKGKTNWVEAICMAVCAILMIYVFRKLGFGKVSGGVMGGVAGALLGIGIYYLFSLLRNKVTSSENL